MNGATDWQLNSAEELLLKQEALPLGRQLLVGLLRVRNESLILDDTLAYLDSLVDVIVAYDDASSDNTCDILWRHPKVAIIVRNRSWLPSIEDRLLSETRHRGLLLKLAREHIDFGWCLCADADERIDGDVRSFLHKDSSPDICGLRISLFDAYLTRTDCDPYRTGQALFNFRQFFGPERRDILMLWRNAGNVRYMGLDAREPQVAGRIGTNFHCQHYGKSLSVSHWEETCNYYMRHFPMESYGLKWQARLGKAIHTESDFGRKLERWGPSLFVSGVTDF